LERVGSTRPGTRTAAADVDARRTHVLPVARRVAPLRLAPVALHRSRSARTRAHSARADVWAGGPELPLTGRTARLRRCPAISSARHRGGRAGTGRGIANGAHRRAVGPGAAVAGNRLIARIGRRIRDNDERLVGGVRWFAGTSSIQSNRGLRAECAAVSAVQHAEGRRNAHKYRNQGPHPCHGAPCLYPLSDNPRKSCALRPVRRGEPSELLTKARKPPSRHKPERGDAASQTDPLLAAWRLGGSLPGWAFLNSLPVRRPSHRLSTLMIFLIFL
jgi:hypothetical protein